MGHYDAIKATASGGYTTPIEFKFKPLDYSVSGISLNRLPGESDAAYSLRLKAANERFNQAQQRQESLIQYQKDKLKREEEHEQKLRQENTELAEARYNSILSKYKANDLNSLSRARSEIAALKNFYTFNKLNKDFDMHNINKTGIDTDWRIFNLKRGEENPSFIDKPDVIKNPAGFDFQPEGQRDFSV